MTAEFTDHDPKFVDYYAAQSVSPKTLERFAAIKQGLMLLSSSRDAANSPLDIGDVGCNTGTQSMLWARDGHRVHGIDISQQLIDIARQRATEQSMQIDFQVASATALPWPDASVDICIAPELLEHVMDWRRVLHECVRVTRPNGLVYLSTTNVLCPKQYEFDLPMYSWYPPALKRHYEKISVTTRPELVNHAQYPAVNWFTFYGLRRDLRALGLASLDRFDLLALKQSTGLKGMAARVITVLPPLRLLGHMLTPYTMIIGRKSA
jgi:2-polyprenyl-3-methyl-5-hydroxy-6-metoxy-1,4-benzoquinol methylase